MSFTTLCIAEKFTLAEAAGKVLAEQRGVSSIDWEAAKKQQFADVADVRFRWLDGHALELAEPDHYLPADVPVGASGKKYWRACDLPIIPTKWQLQPKDSKAARLAKIAEELKACAQVWHMGDPDSEGQLLVDECLDFYGYKGPVKRILINDYNPTPVKAALANIRDNNEAMFRGWYHWGLGRSHYDYLLGMNATRAMTLRARELGYDGKTPLPVGSVQTPLLYVVRERDRLIECFKPIPYYTLAATLQHANGAFRAKWKARESQPGLDAEGRLISEAEASKLADQLARKAGTITAYTKALKQQKAPLPLSMNELQMEAFTRWKYTGEQVLGAAQILYEKHKVLSYPRSDNRYLSLAKHAEASAIIAAVFKLRPDLAGLADQLDAARKSDAFNDKKMEGTPHHGIIPTVPETPVDTATWTEVERNIYDLAARTYLAQFASPYEYQQTSIEAEIQGEVFTAGGRTPAAPGWKAVFTEVEDDDEKEQDDDSAQTLPVMAKDDAAACTKIDQTSRKTKPPARFDDKMLIDCMMNIHKYVTDEQARKRLKEGDGIGTTATRSAIIAQMKERELFIPLDSGSSKLKTSSAARFLIDALPFEVKDPAQAGIFKGQLDELATSADPGQALAKFEAETAAWITGIVEAAKSLDMTLPASMKASPKPAQTSDHPCACGKGHLVQKKGPNGPFWGCTTYPECKNSLPDDKGKPGKPKSTSSLSLVDEKSKCPTCGKPMRLVPAKPDRKAFWSCTAWPECKTSADDKDGKPVFRTPGAPASAAHACPKCGKLLRQLTAKQGPNAGNKFWGCTGYADGCKYSTDDKDGKPVFKEATSAA